MRRDRKKVRLVFLWIAVLSIIIGLVACDQPKNEKSEDRQKELIVEELENTGSTSLTGMWMGDTVYEYSYESNGVTYLHRSVPFGHYRVTNVSTVDASWEVSFCVKEEVTADGKPVEDMENVIQYENVEISMACGADTMPLRAELFHGTLYQSDREKSLKEIEVSFLASGKGWEENLEPLDVLGGLSDSTYSEELGNKTLVLFDSGKNAVQMKSAKGQVLFQNSYRDDEEWEIESEEESYLGMNLTVTSTQEINRAIETMGAFQIRWDAYENATMEQLASGEGKIVLFPYEVCETK